MSDEHDGSVAGPSARADSTTRRDFLAQAVVGGGAAAAAAGFAAAPGGAAAAAEPPKNGADVNPRLFSFVGGSAGGWAVLSVKPVVGDTLPLVERLDIVNGPVPAPPAGANGGGVGWVLRGVTSNVRYATRNEQAQLAAKQAALGRPAATRAALIPIRKTAKWWALTQDDRRALFEERSRHLTIGLKYLPAVARRLHHCRDLAAAEPFDFLTLFDYAPADAAAFEDMVAELRATEEWTFVDREVDVRLERAGG